MTQLVGTGPIAVVDDDEVDRDLLSTFFRRSKLKERFELATFTDGPSFLEYMSGVEAGDKPMPSLVLMDINMPRLDGFQVLGELRSKEKFAQLPVVMFLSNSDSPRDIARCRDLNAGFQEKALSAADAIGFFDALLEV